MDLRSLEQPVDVFGFGSVAAIKTMPPEQPEVTGFGSRLIGRLRHVVGVRAGKAVVGEQCQIVLSRQSDEHSFQSGVVRLDGTEQMGELLRVDLRQARQRVLEQVRLLGLGLGEVGHDHRQKRVGPDSFVDEVAPGMAIGQDEPAVFGFVDVEGVEEAEFLNAAGQGVFLGLGMAPPVPGRAVDLTDRHTAQFLHAVSDGLHAVILSLVLIVGHGYLPARPSVPRQARTDQIAATAN
jgi:hypothetical protein